MCPSSPLPSTRTWKRPSQGIELIVVMFEDLGLHRLGCKERRGGFPGGFFPGRLNLGRQNPWPAYNCCLGSVWGTKRSSTQKKCTLSRGISDSATAFKDGLYRIAPRQAHHDLRFHSAEFAGSAHRLLLQLRLSPLLPNAITPRLSLQVGQ
jgi:hypothetical protein